MFAGISHCGCIFRSHAVLTPDFSEMLRSVPEDRRAGFVFNPVLHRGICRRLNSVSLVIGRLGKAAGVKVDQKGGEPVWASALDLRRGFGARWSRRVSPMTLRDLMQHASVTTTEKFYVGIQAAETAAMLAGLLPAAAVTGRGDQDSGDSGNQPKGDLSGDLNAKQGS